MPGVLRVASWNVNDRGSFVEPSLGGLLHLSNVDIVLEQEANESCLDELASATCTTGL
jgi:hypothetical protein